MCEKKIFWPLRIVELSTSVKGVARKQKAQGYRFQPSRKFHVSWADYERSGDSWITGEIKEMGSRLFCFEHRQ